MLGLVEFSSTDSEEARSVLTQACTPDRPLQSAFHRHFGQSPMQYLRRVRVEAAHRELTDTDPGSDLTVAAIARRHGFSHAARFTKFYAAAYGVLPSYTLRS